MKYTGGYTSLGLIIGMVSQLYDFKNINSRKGILQYVNSFDLMYGELQYDHCTYCFGILPIVITPVRTE